MNYHTTTHRRKNILTETGYWYPRTATIGLGQARLEESTDVPLPSYDENCPLCPGNTRANGEKNPDYTDTFVFVNDFGALTPLQAKDEATLSDNDSSNSALFVSEPAAGECRVICFSPDHNRTLPELSELEILAVVDCWQQNYNQLSAKYKCVHIFENKGAIMGCSQPHPHGQIWAHNHLSTEIEKKLSSFRSYFNNQAQKPTK